MNKSLSLQNNKTAHYFIITLIRLCAFSLILVTYNYHEYLTYILTLAKQIENSNLIDIIQVRTPAECGSREWCEETWKRDKSNYDDYPYPYPWFRQTWFKDSWLNYDWMGAEWEAWLGLDHPKHEFPGDVIMVAGLVTLAGTVIFWTVYFFYGWFFK